MCDDIIKNPADDEIVYAESKRQAAREAIKNKDWSKSTALYEIILKHLPNDLEANLFCHLAKVNLCLFEQGDTIKALSELGNRIDRISDYYDRKNASIESEVLNAFDNVFTEFLIELNDFRSISRALINLNKDRCETNPSNSSCGEFLLNSINDLYSCFQAQYSSLKSNETTNES